MDISSVPLWLSVASLVGAVVKGYIDNTANKDAIRELKHELEKRHSDTKVELDRRIADRVSYTNGLERLIEGVRGDVQDLTRAIGAIDGLAVRVDQAEGRLQLGGGAIADLRTEMAKTIARMDALKERIHDHEMKHLRTEERGDT